MDELLGRHFISLALVFLFSVRLGSQRSARDKEFRFFWLTVISCFLLILQDHAELIASRDPGLRFWRTLFSVAGYVLRSTAILGLLLVILRPERRNWSVMIPWVFNLGVCATAFFTDICFGFDGQYRFYRGPLGYVPFIVPLFYLAAILWLTFKRYDSGKKSDRMILISCALFCVGSALLDAARGGVRLHEAILISSIFFYVFLRSYDVRKDSLTLLLNRQSFYDDCSEMDRKIGAAASLDMNGLKTLNDAEGTHAGDRALARIGERMLRITGPEARAYRIGGDEFVILFQHQDEQRIHETLKRLSGEIREDGYSVAWGYAIREEGESPEELVRKSDLKMFSRKAQYYRDGHHDRRRKREAGNSQLSRETLGKLEEMPDPSAIIREKDHQTEVLAVSQGFCRLFGYADHASAAKDLNEMPMRTIHPDDQERFTGALLRFVDGDNDLDIVYRCSAGLENGYRVIHARGTHDRTENGERIEFVWFMDEGRYTDGHEAGGSPISQALNRALHEESILRAVHYDSLTGLPNLAWFFKLYEDWKTTALREEKQTALLYMDLNGMKYFNHHYGFAEGDRLLKAFAEILVRLFGKERSCHISADRFAAAVTETEAENRISELFREAERMNDGKTLPVHVGICSTEMENIPVSSAYDRAKMACDAIRKSDVSGSYRYNASLRDAEKKQRYLLENIDRAVKERWIRVYYQPIVRSVSRKICDEEALARWIDPVEGFLSPADFIPQLENAGLIYKLDLCVLDQVLEKLREMKAAGIETVPQSINLSRSDFETCDIVEEIRRRVDAAGVPRNRITIEITESIIGSNFEFMKAQVARFRELGFPVWMDDFGSGYSSLDVLSSIEFDLIKFDMSFMRKLDEGESGKIILTELMKMATSLNKDTVCEGVETEAQVHFLQEIGCSKLQGYFFSKPLPPEEIEKRRMAGDRFQPEDAEASAYYETISRLNLYDLGGVTSGEDSSFHHAFSTLPMAVLEIRGKSLRFVRTTPSYREFVSRFFGDDVTKRADDFASLEQPFLENILKNCGGTEARSFFDEKLPDGSVIHSFARRIGVNPVNGDQAFAVAILSVSDPAAHSEKAAPQEPAAGA
ncbi:MAG: EAL domain-containing protein [Clostridia bacterium]|nr:EAL domain-containing protein [Clostridia bacterium]